MEDKRLDFIHSLLKKRQDRITAKMNTQYDEVVKVLDEINTRTVIHGFDPDDDKTSVRFQESQLQANSRFTNIKSAYSRPSTTSIITNPTPIPTSRSSMTTPINKIFSSQQKELSASMCKFNPDNCFNKNFSTQFDETSELLQPSKISFNSTSSSYMSNSSFNSGSSCNLFPCTLLQSYTSIVGSKNDRKVKRTKTALDTWSWNSNLRSESNISNEVEIESCARNEQEFVQECVENFKSNLSVRRPLRKKHSFKDFELKISALEKQAKFCCNLNHETFNTTDRNIRYGQPLPRKKLYRQLKLIADFVR